MSHRNEPEIVLGLITLNRSSARPILSCPPRGLRIGTRPARNARHSHKLGRGFPRRPTSHQAKSFGIPSYTHPLTESAHVLRRAHLLEHVGTRLGVEEQAVRLGHVLEPNLQPVVQLGQDRRRRQQLQRKPETSHPTTANND